MHLERVAQQEREDRAPVAVIAPASAVDTVYSGALLKAQNFYLPKQELLLIDFVASNSQSQLAE